MIASAWAQHASSVLKPGTIFSLAMPQGDEAQVVLPISDVVAGRLSSSASKASGLAVRAEHGQPPMLFCTLLSCHAAQLRTVKRAPAGKQPLHRGEIAITVHRATCAHSEAQRVFLDAKPAICSEAGDAVHVLGHLCPTLESLHRMRLWTSKPGLNLLGLPLPVDLSDNCRQALSKLLKQFGFP